MLIWLSDRGGSEIGGIHIGPTQEFASEHQLGAPQSRQDLPGRHITGDHLKEDGAREGGSAATPQSITTAATTVFRRLYYCC